MQKWLDNCNIHAEAAASRSGPESGEIYAKRHALQRTRGSGGSVRSTTLSKAGRAIISAALISSLAPYLPRQQWPKRSGRGTSVTGVRGKPRTVQDSPEAIDVFNEDAINDVAFTDMNDILRTLVPSYGVRRKPIAMATFIRPADWRGLLNRQDLSVG